MLKSQKLLRKLNMMQFVFERLNKSITRGSRQENSMRDVDRNEETLKEKDRDKTEGRTHWKGELTKFKVIRADGTNEKARKKNIYRQRNKLLCEQKTK